MMFRLDGIFLTHFHSDHISEIYEANPGSWVEGARATQGPGWARHRKPRRCSKPYLCS